MAAGRLTSVDTSSGRWPSRRTKSASLPTVVVVPAVDALVPRARSLRRHRDGPPAAALRRLGGCSALVELGIVDGTKIDTVIASALAGSDHRELHRAWELLTLETWVRQVV